MGKQLYEPKTKDSEEQNHFHASYYWPFKWFLFNNFNIYYDIIDIISLSLFKSTVHQSTGNILVKVTSLLSWFYSFGVCFYVRYNFPLPVSVLTELLGALVHCWSLAFRVMVRFWLHVSGGREHIPSDVELQSNVWTAPLVSVATTTYSLAPADSLYITHAEFVKQSISTSDSWGTQGTGGNQGQEIRCLQYS